MASSTAPVCIVPRDLLLCSIVFKFTAMIIGFLGNVFVIVHIFFSSKEKTATSYLIGNLAAADLLVRLTIDNQRNGMETRYDWDANSVIRAIT